VRWSDLLSLAGPGGAGFYYARALDPMMLRQVVATVAELSGTLLGFIAAAVAILMTIPDTAFTRNLRKTGHLRELMIQMYWAAVWALAVVVVAVAGMIAPAHATLWLALAAIGLLGATLVRIALAGHAFYNVLDVFSEDH